MKHHLSIWVLLLFILLITIPYLFAQFYAGTEYVFGGFLLNPQDGNSYLAKMYEGWNGSWSFQLPYSAEQSEGTLLFLFYLFLGHVGKWLGIPLIIVFHLARVLSAVFLAYTLFDFVDWIFNRNPRDGKRAFALILFGSGLGWLVVGWGVITSDLWVAETFPFLSSFANPHFCLGMAILLRIFLEISVSTGKLRMIRLVIWGLLLSIIMPFGIAVAGLVSGIWIIWDWKESGRLNWLPLLAAFIPGGIFLIYQYWAIQANPLLSLWNSQNVTQSPPIWDFLISILPSFLLAIWAIWKAIQRGEFDHRIRLLIVWTIAGFIMVYFPFSLQRRFMFAYYIPIGVLAVQGLRDLPGFLRRFQRRAFPFVFIVSIITNFIVLLIACFGILNHSPLFFLNQNESTALTFIRESTPQNAVILCSPEMGNYLPAWTGRRVLYGHEFETVNADENKKLVKDLLDGEIDEKTAVSILKQHQVQYVLIEPGQLLGNRAFLNQMKPVYQNETVQIYSW